jgi:pimeloyl-ACP methyl ester carboxylesterase
MVLKNKILYRTGKKPILWDVHFNANGKKKPLIIFCHGYKGFKDWGCWDLVADQFCKAELYFVKFNFSHNGGTTSDPIDFPDLEAFAENNYTKELEDLQDVLDHFTSKTSAYNNNIDTSDITVIGHSRGGGISIIKTKEDHRIKRLITWASICDFGKRTATVGELEQWRKTGVKHVLNSRTKQNMPHNFQFYEDFKDNVQRLNIKSAIQQISVPVLIIHAKDDPSVNYEEAESLRSWNNENSLLTVEHSNHVFDASHPWEHDRLPRALEGVVKESIRFIKGKH